MPSIAIHVHTFGVPTDQRHRHTGGGDRFPLLRMLLLDRFNRRKIHEIRVEIVITFVPDGSDRPLLRPLVTLTAHYKFLTFLHRDRKQNSLANNPTGVAFALGKKGRVEITADQHTPQSIYIYTHNENYRHLERPFSVDNVLAVVMETTNEPGGRGDWLFWWTKCRRRRVNSREEQQRRRRRQQEDKHLQKCGDDETWQGVKADSVGAEDVTVVAVILVLARVVLFAPLLHEKEEVLDGPRRYTAPRRNPVLWGEELEAYRRTCAREIVQSVLP